jgi:hypothetical protein
MIFKVKFLFPQHLTPCIDDLFDFLEINLIEFDDLPQMNCGEYGVFYMKFQSEADARIAYKQAHGKKFMQDYEIKCVLMQGYQEIEFEK